jgi:hypothetical protein
MSKKTTTKTEVATATPTVTLMNYTIKAVIPTGPYANVQPEITVQASSLADAQDYVLPHIDALFEKYLNLSDRPKPRVVDTTPIKPPTPAPVEKKEGVAFVKADGPHPTVEQFTPAPEVVEPKKFEAEQPASTAFDKAKMAVESCRSIEALNMIAEKIEQSVKLDALDKADLSVLVEVKRKEF